MVEQRIKNGVVVVFIEEMVHGKNMDQSLIHGGISLSKSYELLAK